MNSFNIAGEKGSPHYKSGSIEPLDLIKAGHMLIPFCLGNIIKYAFRMNHALNLGDLNKIIHYAEILKEELHAPSEKL